MIDGRKITIGFVVLAVLGCLVYGGTQVYDWARKLPATIADAQSKMAAAIEPVVTDLAAKDWDPVAVTGSVSPAWIAASKSGELGTVLAFFKPLGTVERSLGVQGFNENGNNGVWRATATEKFAFKGGAAIVTAGLSWKEPNWLVDTITVTPVAK
jgi:hypothetical protein